MRPAASGFARVRIAPIPGKLTSFSCAVAHPRGRIELELRFAEGRAEGMATLPAGVTGEFVWNGSATPLAPGRNRIAGR